MMYLSLAVKVLETGNSHLEHKSAQAIHGLIATCIPKGYWDDYICIWWAEKHVRKTTKERLITFCLLQWAIESPLSSLDTAQVVRMRRGAIDCMITFCPCQTVVAALSLALSWQGLHAANRKYCCLWWVVGSVIKRDSGVSLGIEEQPKLRLEEAGRWPIQG